MLVNAGVRLRFLDDKLQLLYVDKLSDRTILAHKRRMRSNVLCDFVSNVTSGAFCENYGRLPKGPSFRSKLHAFLTANTLQAFASGSPIEGDILSYRDRVLNVLVNESIVIMFRVILIYLAVMFVSVYHLSRLSPKVRCRRVDRLFVSKKK